MSSALSVALTLSRADRALRAGDSPAAQALFGEVLARFPGNARARAGLMAAAPDESGALISAAKALQDAGQTDAAERKWAEAARLLPASRRCGLSLALCRLDLGRAAGALAAVEQVLARTPADATALDIKGRCLRDLGDLPGAEQCHRAALGQGVADAAPLNHLGILEQARGNTAKAEGYYRRALALCPDHPDLHHHLSRCLTYTPDTPHLGDMVAALAAADRTDPEQAPLHFALFKAFDDLGEHDTAFAHLAAGNALKKLSLRFDLHREARLMRLAMSLSQGAGRPVPPAPHRPIFIVGLPRSGTTLVERILSQAEGTQACGELSVVSHGVAERMRHCDTGQMSPEDVASLRADITQGMADYSNGAPVMIDKMPLNFRWIGFICAAFPEARIVHVTRDPMAVAWSLYRHLFAGRGNGFAYDIVDIAAYMRLHREMMEIWQQWHGAQICNVAYEDLTREPEPTMRRLVAACGLDWTEDCLAPHLAKGAVLTASAPQVRRPIYGGSDAAWQNYAQHLAPMRAALGASGVI